jgi:hypothetical protein
MKGKLSGSDADATSVNQQNRNLSFYTDITEFTSQFEFNFLPYHTFVINNYFSPYLYLGIGFGWINPKTSLNGNEYELRAFLTEGQSAPYNKMQLVIPFGFGFKWKLNHRFLFSCDWGLRRTFTDYIDDVSNYYPKDPTEMSTTAQALSNRTLETDGKNIWGTQRGNPHRKDLYSFTTISFLIRVGKNPNLCRYNTQ